MSLTDPSPATRSPSQIAFGLGTDLVRSVAIFFGFRRPAETGCRPSCSRREEITLDAWLAGLALSHTGPVVDLAGSEPAPLGTQSRKVVIPRRLAITVISSAYPPVDAQGPCLLFEMHSNTEPQPWASTNPGHFIQGERA